MIEQWKELKETIIELRDGDGTTAQQEVCKFLANYMEVLEKQMQEPCEDEYVKVPKKALKYRTAGMVAYNAEWLRNHFDIERAVICGAQEPCEDAISRQEAVEAFQMFREYESNRSNKGWVNRIETVLNQLPPVNPQPKTGHWITWKEAGKYIPSETKFECSVCHDAAQTLYNGLDLLSSYCPNCGAKMIEPQESEGKE